VWGAAEKKGKAGNLGRAIKTNGRGITANAVKRYPLENRHQPENFPGSQVQITLLKKRGRKEEVF